MNRTETRDSADRLFSWALAAALIAISPAVVAQQAPQDTHALDEIVVVGVTPVPGFKVDKDKIPGKHPDFEIERPDPQWRRQRARRARPASQRRQFQRHARGSVPA